MDDTLKFNLAEVPMDAYPKEVEKKSAEFNLEGKSVYIAIPCHDFKLHLNTAVGLLELKEGFMRYGVKATIQTLGGSALIDKARTDLVNHYLRDSDADYFFFLDSDIGFQASDFLRLMALIDNPDIDMISAAYPAKIDTNEEGGKYFINADFNEDGYPIIDNNGLLKVNAMGLGFCMIKREVLTGMAQTYKDDWFMGDVPASSEQVKLINFFIPILDKNHTYWGEDIAFFIRAAAAGYNNLYVDLNVALKHVGRKVYTGDVVKALTGSVVEIQKSGVIRDNPFSDAVKEFEKNDAT